MTILCRLGRKTLTQSVNQSVSIIVTSWLLTAIHRHLLWFGMKRHADGHIRSIHILFHTVQPRLSPTSFYVTPDKSVKYCISMSVCLFVFCLSALYASLFWKPQSKFHEIYCTCYLWLWLGHPVMSLYVVFFRFVDDVVFWGANRLKNCLCMLVYVQYFYNNLLKLFANVIYRCSLFGDLDLYLEEICCDETVTLAAIACKQQTLAANWLAVLSLLLARSDRPSTADECICQCEGWQVSSVPYGLDSCMWLREQCEAVEAEGEVWFLQLRLVLITLIHMFMYFLYLQIKNVIFHAVKDAVAVLESSCPSDN